METTELSFIVTTELFSASAADSFLAPGYTFVSKLLSDCGTVYNC